MVRLLLAFLFAVSAHAALITSAPVGGATTVVGTGNTCAGGPIGPFTVTQHTFAVCWPSSQSFGLSNNGFWNLSSGGFGYIGLNTANASFTLDLAASYSSINLFLNYDLPLSNGGPILSAIADDGVTVLESYNIDANAPIVTPSGVNAGAFRGISRASADIRYITVANGFTAIHSFTVDGAAAPTGVPEPSTFLLLAPALLFLLRRNSC